jgi:FkbM family methyltransferase
MGIGDSLFRSLPAFRGKGRLARMMFKTKISGEKDLNIRGQFGCEYKLPNVQENIGFDIFINGIYEPETSDFIIRNVPQNGVFLDLGANIGAITIPVHNNRKDIQIICVEAAPSVYKYLQHNLKKNVAESVYSINRALFYSDDEMMNFYSPEEKYGKGSLASVFTDKRVTVKTIRLDTLLRDLGIQKVHLVKIDVEGFEYHVFKGATALLSARDAPDIIFEFVDWAEKLAGGINVGASQQILQDLGYQIFYFDHRNEMKKVTGILTEGFSMLFATKNNINR